MSDIEMSEAEESAVKEMMEDHGAEMDGAVAFTPEEKEQPDAVQEEGQGQEEIEATKEAEPEPEFKSSRQDMVPHQAMHAERVRRQEAEAKLAQIESRLQKWEQQQQQAQEPQYVDPLVDPEGFKRYQDHVLGRTQQMVQQQQQTMQAEQMQRVRTEDAVRLEQEFKTTTPDYDDAVRFANESRVNELRMYGFDDNQIVMQIAQDANAIYDAGRRLGMNPAQLLYEQAKARGYTAQPVQQQTEEKIEALATAQKQTQGVGSGGARQGGMLTAEQIANMSEAEVANLSDEEIARAMGG